MNVIYLALLCGLIATSYVHTSEARLHAESMVGGTATAVDQNTYSVSIQTNYYHFCGGGILNNRHIITAAHCFIDLETNRFENEEYIVVAGTPNAHNPEEPHRVTREVAKIYIPREYNPIMVRSVGNNKFADIAVLELTADLGLNRFITNVVLPPNARSYPTYENEQAVVCGYGHNWVTIHHDPHTNKNVEVTGSNLYERKFAQVKILPHTECRNIFRDVMDSQLCGQMRQLLTPASPNGLCTGDSGSPLVIGKTIIGVVSTSPTGCREDVEPSMYTRVTSFIQFIRKAMTGVRTANMRLAKYKVKACGRRCIKKVLVEQ